MHQPTTKAHAIAITKGEALRTRFLAQMGYVGAALCAAYWLMYMA